MLANGAPICYKKRRYCLFGGPAMKNSCQRTIYACYAGYVVQAVVNNFVPLLFVMFERSYQIPLSRITLLITVNFCIQLGVDLLSTWFLDRIGYRAAILLSHAFSAAGLVLLTILPDVFPDPAAGLTVAVAVYALGGGLLEVLISPIMESCPTDNKERYMSLLHSFYCWGHMAVVLLSTAFFAVFGIEKWKIMALLWALVPLANGIFFAGSPLYPIQSGETGALPLRELCQKKLFWVFMLMMLCAGALMVIFCRTRAASVAKTNVFNAGMVAIVAVYGVAWMADTMFASHLANLKEVLTEWVREMPWTYAIVLLLVSKLVNSQAAAIATIVPVALAIGTPPGLVVAFSSACYGYYILPTYPSDLAAIQFDRSGTTHIGRFVINHSFILPGLIGVITASIVGYFLGLAYGYI